MFLELQTSIQMISEGSCEAEDWSNDAENSALHHRNNKLNFILFKLQNYFEYSIFDQINAALASTCNNTVTWS